MCSVAWILFFSRELKGLNPQRCSILVVLPGLGECERRGESQKKIKDEPLHSCKGWNIHLCLLFVKSLLWSLWKCNLELGHAEMAHLPAGFWCQREHNQRQRHSWLHVGSLRLWSAAGAGRCAPRCWEPSSDVFLRDISPPWQFSLQGSKEVSLLHWLVVKSMLLPWQDTLDWAFRKEQVAHPLQKPILRECEESGQDCNYCRIKVYRTVDGISLCLSVYGHLLGFPGDFGLLQVSKEMYSASPTT